jgi:microcystin-dependent protein
MSRNGSGVYTKVNTFVSGNPVTAAGHNQNWDDLASEITNSVAADGQTTMTGPLKAASGTVGAPSVSFASDPDSGVYRIGSNNLGVAVNGAKVLDVATTGLGVTGGVTATTSVDAPAIKQSGFSLLPVGVILPYGGAAAPTGYLLCQGQSLLRASYVDLFAAIGTTYGAADGTHFNVPDLQGRAPVGKDATTTRLTSATMTPDGNTLGATGGAQVSVLVTGNLPPYTPAGTNTGGDAQFSVTVAAAQTGAGQQIYSNISGGTGLPTLIDTTATQPTFTGTAQGGTSTAFTNVQPSLVTNYIIFAGI